MTTTNEVTRRRGGVPPYLDGMNHKRAGWAGIGLDAFMDETGTDVEDVVADFIADMMHWCDRNDQDFKKQLARARRMYNAETTPE